MNYLVVFWARTGSIGSFSKESRVIKADDIDLAKQHCMNWLNAMGYELRGCYWVVVAFTPYFDEVA